MPAAVGIYWIFKCLITTVKQYVLHKAMPMPVFTEEDYKRAEREMKGKLRPEERAPLAGRATGAKKSLHSIDDEDELPARDRTARDFGEEEDSIYERRAKEAAQKKEAESAKRLESAKLKEDRKNNKKK
jgi:membrane protein insertase Oxa1/YidC/SpoIIIJ